MTEPTHDSTRYDKSGTAYGWLADDGQHVWLRHDCGGESVTADDEPKETR